MYMPVATALPMMPATRKPTRDDMSCGAGRTASIASSDSPTSTTLASVPSPGRWRSGTHRARTTMLTATTTIPIDTPVRREMPWWSTSHGSSPRSARTRNATLAPNSHRPTSSCTTRVIIAPLGMRQAVPRRRADLASSPPRSCTSGAPPPPANGLSPEPRDAVRTGVLATTSSDDSRTVISDPRARCPMLRRRGGYVSLQLLSCHEDHTLCLRGSGAGVPGTANCLTCHTLSPWFMTCQPKCATLLAWPNPGG